MLQSTAGPLFLEMKLLSALNMKLRQCLTYEMLWSRYLFQLFERHQVLGRLMGNGGEKFKFILFSLILTSNLWRFTDGCHNWLIDYEVLDSGFLCPWVCLTYKKKGYVLVKVKISWDTGGFHKMFTWLTWICFKLCFVPHFSSTFWTLQIHYVLSCFKSMSSLPIKENSELLRGGKKGKTSGKLFWIEIWLFVFLLGGVPFITLVQTFHCSCKLYLEAFINFFFGRQELLELIVEL